jgi:hypothetical protein
LSGNVHSRTAAAAAQSFDARVITRHNPIPTEYEQSLSRTHLSQRVSAQWDVELTVDNHQNSPPLLSSETVIKYSSHQERD